MGAGDAEMLARADALEAEILRRLDVLRRNAPFLAAACVTAAPVALTESGPLAWAGLVCWLGCCGLLLWEAHVHRGLAEGLAALREARTDLRVVMLQQAAIEMGLIDRPAEGAA